MGVGQLSESDAVDALRLPFYSSSHPTGSHGWRNQFDLGNPDLVPRRERTPVVWVSASPRVDLGVRRMETPSQSRGEGSQQGPAPGSVTC